MKKFLEIIKLRIAIWLDKNPKYCWAALVMWSLGYDGYKISNCTKEESRCCNKNYTYPDGTCYCGKFKNDKRKEDG